MGFTPIGSKRTYWSDEVTVQVEAGDASRKDAERLQGTWAAVSVERGGKPLSADEVKKLDIRLTVKGDRLTLMPLASRGPEHFPHGTFRLDATRRPKAIDFTIDLPLRAEKKTS